LCKLECFSQIQSHIIKLLLCESRLTGSESQGQEEAACIHPVDPTTGVLFTATNTIKFASAVTQLSWVLSFSYYRASTFLPCRINKPKMNKLGTTLVKNQPFWLLWCPFPYLRLKVDRLKSNSIVTRELIPLFYVESANQHSLQSIQPPLLCGFQYSILWLKKSRPVVVFFTFVTFTHLTIFQEMKLLICEYTFVI